MEAEELIEARAAGYAWALAQAALPLDDYESDGACVSWYGGPVPAAIEEAWYQGVRAAQRPHLEDYHTPESAAALKGVSEQSLRALLRDDKRRMRWFPGAIRVGEGSAARWYLPPDEVGAWQPGKRGRPRRQTT